MSVYKCINKIQAALSKEGIGKDRKNQQQGYLFRGIDDIYNELSSLLAEHGLCILPKVFSRECVERQSKSGGALFFVTVGVEFSFICSEDGSAHVVTVYGEACDSADKATNKAMSAAYKYACLQTFCIPTEGDHDADETTHQVVKEDQRKIEVDPDKKLFHMNRMELCETVDALRTAFDAAKHYAISLRNGELLQEFKITKDRMKEKLTNPEDDSHE